MDDRVESTEEVQIIKNSDEDEVSSSEKSSKRLESKKTVTQLKKINVQNNHERTSDNTQLQNSVKENAFINFRSKHNSIDRLKSQEKSFTDEVKNRFEFKSHFRDLNGDTQETVAECIKDIPTENRSSLQTIGYYLIKNITKLSGPVEEDLMFENIHYIDDNEETRILSMRFENPDNGRKSILSVSHLKQSSGDELPDILKTPNEIYKTSTRVKYLKSIKSIFGYSLHEIEFQYLVRSKMKLLLLYKDGEVEKIDAHDMVNNKRLNCRLNVDDAQTQCSCI